MGEVFYSAFGAGGEQRNMSSGEKIRFAEGEETQSCGICRYWSRRNMPLAHENIGICKQGPGFQPKTAAEWCGQFKLRSGMVERQREDPSPEAEAHEPPHKLAERRDQEQEQKVVGLAGGQ